MTHQKPTAIEREAAREVVLQDRLSRLERLQASYWRNSERVAAIVAKVRNALRTIRANRLNREYLTQYLAAKIAHIRSRVRETVDFYLLPVFRKLKSMGHPKAGAALGIGRKIASGGKYTWRQYVFWDTLRAEAGFDPDDCSVIED